MGTDKRERQKAGRQARIEAARHAQRKAETRRRVMLGVAVIAFAAALIGLATWLARDDGDNNAASSSTTTTSLATSSTTSAVATAAGKPCVPLADPLPAGAPDVPIEAGPPPTELAVTDITEGTGDPVPAGATVTVQYIGVSCSTGKIFDSSWTRGQPATFGLDQVIPGWTQGLVGMKAGGRRLLVIPPDLAYGDNPGSPLIAPGETLYFVVDMESFVPADASTTATSAAG